MRLFYFKLPLTTRPEDFFFQWAQLDPRSLTDTNNLDEIRKGQPF